MIRPATKSDIPGIIGIEKVSFSEPWDEKLFLDAIDSEDKYPFVAQIGKSIIGYIVFENVLDEGHITNLAVGKDHQGKGIATELVSAALDLAKSLKIKEIFLEVREPNEAARKLYSKFGFEQIGRRKKYYSAANEDALILHVVT